MRSQLHFANASTNCLATSDRYSTSAAALLRISTGHPRHSEQFHGPDEGEGIVAAELPSRMSAEIIWSREGDRLNEKSRDRCNGFDAVAKRRSCVDENPRRVGC
jgi:hypothetical protein